MKLFTSLAPIEQIERDTDLTISKVVRKNKLASEPDHIALDELTLVCAHIKATPAQAEALVDAWKRHAVAVTSAKVLSIRQGVRRKALDGVFGKNPVLLKIMRSIADGSIPARAGHQHGFTVEGTTAFIAPSHPRMTALCYDLEITTRDLGNALASLPGAERKAGRRIGDIYCRTIALPIESLEAAV